MPQKARAAAKSAAPAKPAAAGRSGAKGASATASRKTASSKAGATKSTATKSTAAKKSAPAKAAGTATKSTAKKSTTKTAAAATRTAAKKSTAKKPAATPTRVAAKSATTKTAATKATASKAATSPGTTPAKRATPAQKPAARKPVSPRSLPVRDDETPWTAKELREVRAEIEADIAHLQGEITVAEADLVGLMRDAGDGAGDDQADAGAKTFEREQEISLANNAREMLRQNLHALERLEDGTYGVCESCGNAIGKLRLQAAPRATLCLTCKTKQERR